jgi:hypothetical protein
MLGGYEKTRSSDDNTLSTDHERITSLKEQLRSQQQVAQTVTERLDDSLEDEDDEPLLRENPRRFVVFPIQYPDIWEF